MNKKVLFLSVVSLLALIGGIKTTTFADVLTCDIKTSCASSDVRLTYLSSTTNAHVEFAGGASVYPRSICCSSNGATVASTTLQVVETDRTGVTASSCAQVGGKVLFTFPGVHPSNTVYTMSNAGKVSKITLDGKSSNFSTAGVSSLGITSDSAGNLYIVNNVSSNVTKITPSGASSTFGTTGSGPYAITIDPSGNIYTANNDSNNVSKITPLGVSSIFGTTGSNPNGITIDLQGNIYTANYSSNNVTKITPAGASSTLGTTGSSPRGIIADSSGNIYVANTSSNSVTKITPQGISSTFSPVGISPNRVTIDVQGNIYTVGELVNNVTKITPAGASSTLGTTGDNPQGITVDAVGNIYVANVASNSVTKITPANFSTTFATVQSPRDLLITPTNGGHVGTSTAYQREACLIATSTPWNMISGFQSSSCSGYGTTVFSMSQAGDNASVAASSTYSQKLCLTAWTDPSISFSLSDTAISFGTLSSASTRWAMSTAGTSTEPIGTSRSFDLTTTVSNVPGGFSIYMSGSNLTNTASSTVTIASMATPGSLTVGTDQFGIQTRRDNSFSTIATTLDPNYGGVQGTPFLRQVFCD